MLSPGQARDSRLDKILAQLRSARAFKLDCPADRRWVALDNIDSLLDRLWEILPAERQAELKQEAEA